MRVHRCSIEVVLEPIPSLDTRARCFHGTKNYWVSIKQIQQKLFSMFDQLHNTAHFTCLLTTKGSGEVRQGCDIEHFEALKGEYEVKLSKQTNSYWLFY